jgi:hypothetical protein
VVRCWTLGMIVVDDVTLLEGIVVVVVDATYAV